MKKYLIFLTLVLALSLGAFGVGCAGGSEVTFAEDEIVLGRYEERQLEVVYDGKEKLSWSSSDESIVTVTDGYAVAQGTGTATVTAAAGKKSGSVTVKVRDDGSKPFIDGDDVTIMKGQTADSGFKVIYLEKEAPNAELVYETADPSVAAVSADGKITGVAVGSTTVSVNCTYKGLVLNEKVYGVTVTESTFMETEENIDLFLIDSEYVQKSAKIDPVVYVNAVKVENPEVSVSVVSGGEYVDLSGNTVTAKAMGTAVLKAEYAAASLSKNITVNVYENYIEDNDDFYYAGIWGSTYKPYDGTDERFVGSYVYTTGARNGSGSWDWHLSSKKTETEGEINFKTQDIIEAGYKYFSYKLFYTGTTEVYLGLGDNAFWVKPGAGVVKDWLYLLKDGEVTNKMEANTWITVVVNFDRILDTGKKCDLFVLSDGPNEVTYVKDVRYYYNSDGIFPEGWEEPEPNVVTYTKMDGYVQASNNDFMLSEATEYYLPFDGMIDGVENPYLYKNRNQDWWRGRICLSASHESTYGGGTYENLKTKTYDSDWVTFDMWYSGTDGIHVGISGGIDSVGPMAVALNGSPQNTAAAQVKYVYILENGKLTDKLVANRWITIAINFELVADSGVPCELYIGLDNAVSAFAFINNIRYYTDEQMVLGEEAQAEDTLTAYEQKQNDELFVEEGDSSVYEAYPRKVGDMKDVYRVTANAASDSDNKLQFKTLHADSYGGDWAAMGAAVKAAKYTYAVVNMYLTDDTPLVVYVPDAAEASKYKKAVLTPGIKYEGDDVIIVDVDGVWTNTAEKEKWFMLAISLAGITEDGETRTAVSFNAATTAYVTNVRYYTCDAFKVGNVSLNAVGLPDELDPFTQMEITEFRLAETAPSAVISEIDGEIAGIDGVNLYYNPTGDAWNGRAYFISTTPFAWGGTNDGWLENNKKIYEKGWKYVTFNALIPEAASVMFFIPIDSGDPQMVTVKTDTAITDARIIVIDSEGNNAGKLLVGEWMTVALRIDAAAGENNGAWASAAFTFTGGKGSMYYTNFRYYTNEDFLSGTLPEGYVKPDNPDIPIPGGEEDPEKPELTEFTLEVMASFGNDELTVENDATGAEYAAYDQEVGGVKGAYKFTGKEGSDLWPYQRRLQFYHTSPAAHGLSGDMSHVEYNNKLYELGWEYAVFDVYIESDVNIVVRYPEKGAAATKELEIKLGEKLTGDVALLMKDGEKTDTIEKGGWYTVAFRIDGTAAAPGVEEWTWAEASVALSGAGVVYINNIRYAKAVPAERK